MGLMDDIKALKEGSQGFMPSQEEEALKARLNALFYLDKNIEKETEFIQSVMTRGQDTAERKGLHASAVIKPEQDFCLRQQVLSLFYKQAQGEQVPVGLKRIFSEGDAIHEKWQRLFIRGGYCNPLDCDFTMFSQYYDLSYTPDIICTIDGIRYVGEIKSMNTHAYRKMLETNGEHASGKKQLFLYMFLTGIYNGFTLCEDKNTQDFTVRLYRYDQKQIYYAIERLEQIQASKIRLKAMNKITRRKTQCTSYNCEMAKQCPMRETCWKKNKVLL